MLTLPLAGPPPSQAGDFLWMGGEALGWEWDSVLSSRRLEGPLPPCCWWAPRLSRAWFQSRLVGFEVQGVPSNKLRSFLITSGGPGQESRWWALEARSPQGLCFLSVKKSLRAHQAARKDRMLGLGPRDRAGRARLRGSLHRDWERCGPKARERPGWNADTNCSAPHSTRNSSPLVGMKNSLLTPPFPSTGVSGGPHPSPLCLSRLDRMGGGVCGASAPRRTRHPEEEQARMWLMYLRGLSTGRICGLGVWTSEAVLNPGVPVLVGVGTTLPRGRSCRASGEGLFICDLRVLLFRLGEEVCTCWRSEAAALEGARHSSSAPGTGKYTGVNP